MRRGVMCLRGIAISTCVSLVVLSCDGSPSAPKKAAPRVEMSDRACAEEGEELGRWWMALLAEGRGECDEHDCPPLVAQPPRANSRGPLIKVLDSAVILNHLPMIGDELEDLPRNLAFHLSQPPLIPGVPRVMAVPEAPWNTIVGVVEGVRLAGFRELIFVFRARSRLEKPPPAPKSLVGFDNIFARCPNALDYMVSLRELPDPFKMEVFSRDVPDKIVDCDCHVDIAALRWTLWRLMWRDTLEPTTFVRVDISSEVPATQFLRAHAATRWSEMHPRLLGESKNPSWSFAVTD